MINDESEGLQENNTVAIIGDDLPDVQSQTEAQIMRQIKNKSVQMVAHEKETDGCQK